MKKKIFIFVFLGIAILFGSYKILFPSSAGGSKTPIDNNGATSTVMEKPSTGTPDDYDAYQNLAIATGVFLSADSFECSTEGVVKAKVAMMDYNQTVADSRCKSNGVIFSQALSLSTFKKVGEQKYFTENGVLVRRGNVKSETNCVWNEKVKNYTNEDFLETYGQIPQGLTKYVLNEETLLTGELVSKNEDGTYTFKYTADPAIGTSNIVREMKMMADSPTYPSVESTEITITINDKWEPVSIGTKDVYKIEISGLGNIKCSSSLVETVTVFNDEVTIPYEDFFKPLVGTIPNDDDNDDVVTKDVSEYLATAFGKYMVGTEGNFDLTMAVNDKVINGKVNFNLSNTDFKVLLGDLYVNYVPDKAYIQYKDISGYLDINKALDLFKTESSSSSSLVEPDFLNSMLDNATVTDDGTNALVVLPIELQGIKLDVYFYLSYVNGDLVLDSLEAKLNQSGITLDIQLVPSEKATYPEITNKDNDLSNIYILANPILDIIKNKKASIVVNETCYTSDSVTASINGVINIDFTNTDLIKAQAILNIDSSFGKFDNAVITYMDNLLYIDLDDIHLVTSINDLESLSDLLPKDNNEKSIDFDLEKILKGLSISETGDINVNLDLSFLLPILSDISIEIAEENNELQITTNLYGFGLTVKAFDGEINKNDFGYIEVNDIIDLFTPINNIIQDKKALITINPITIDGFGISGDILIDFNETLKVSANINLVIDDLSFNDINITYIDNLVYISYQNIALKGNVEELSAIIKEYLPEQASTSTKPSIPKIDINTLIMGLTINEGVLSLNLDLSSIAPAFSDLVVSLSKNDESLTVNSNLFGLGVKVSRTTDIVAPKDIAYQDMSKLKGIIDYAMNIYNHKQAMITFNNISFTQDNLDINLSGIIDIDFSSDIKAKASIDASINGMLIEDITVTYINETIYLDYDDVHISASITEIKNLMSTIDISADNTTSLDTSSLQTVSASALIEENYLNIILALDQEYNLEISLDERLTISNDQLNIKAYIEKGNTLITQPTNEYVTLGSLAKLIKPIKSIIDSKKASIILPANSLEINNLNIVYSGSIDVDFNDMNNIKAQALLDLKVNNIVIDDVTITYINNMVYIDYSNIHLSATIEEIKNVINEFSSSSSSTMAVDSINLPSIIESFSGDDIISIVLNLASLEVDKNLTLSLQANENTLEINVSPYATLLVSSSSKTISLSNTSYESLSEFDTLIDSIKTYLNSNALNIQLSTSLDIKGISLIANADLNISLISESLEMAGTIRLNISNTIHDIKIVAKDSTFYLTYGYLTIKLNQNEIKPLVSLVSETFNLDLNSTSSTSLNDININSLIEGLSINNNELIVNANLESFIENTLLNLHIFATPLEASIEVDDIENELFSLANTNVLVAPIESFTLTVPTENVTDYNDLCEIISYVDEILVLAKEDNFNLNFASEFTTNKKVGANTTTTYVSINGNINITVFENGHFDLRLNCNVIYPTESHHFTINIIEDYIYCTYYSDKGSSAEALKMRMSVPNLMSVIKAVGSMLNLDLSILDKLGLQNVDSLDLSALESIKPTGDLLSETNISEFIKGISVTEDALDFILNKDALNLDNDLNITLSRNNNAISRLEIMDISSTSNIVTDDIITGTKIMSGFVSIDLVNSDFTPISVPDDKDTYMDFSSAYNLVRAFGKTASLKETGFHITGSAAINIIGFDITINFDIKIEVKEDGSPKILAVLNVPYFPLVATKTDSTIYYEDNNLYVSRYQKPLIGSGSTQNVTCTLAEFMSIDNLADNIVYLLGFSDLVGSPIKDAITNPEADPNYPRRVDTVLTDYQYSQSTVTINGVTYNDCSTYNVKLSGANLAENKNIGDMDLKIYENSSNQLFGVTGTIKLISIATLNLNLGLDVSGSTVTVSKPNLTFTHKANFGA